MNEITYDVVLLVACQLESIVDILWEEIFMKCAIVVSVIDMFVPVMFRLTNSVCEVHPISLHATQR